MRTFWRLLVDPGFPDQPVDVPAHLLRLRWARRLTRFLSQFRTEFATLPAARKAHGRLQPKVGLPLNITRVEEPNDD
jgi:hypothetical protein